MRKHLVTTTAFAALMMATGVAHADMAAAEKFLNEEINGMSVLSADEQKAEMQWFIDAAKPFADMEIKVVSETITTHEYESKVLAPAFEAITGIKVTHDLIGEGDVVEPTDDTQMHQSCRMPTILIPKGIIKVLVGRILIGNMGALLGIKHDANFIAHENGVVYPLFLPGNAIPSSIIKAVADAFAAAVSDVGVVIGV